MRWAFVCVRVYVCEESIIIVNINKSPIATIIGIFFFLDISMKYITITNKEHETIGTNVFWFLCFVC